ncbi:PQQ-like beta-propeller repeat protein [bacterium]|nr:PQQ-like beta-propeller repeat protein [bacterium]MCI0602109.1 PQQ-like beta-propeller repeat protein [bacterium]
MKTSLALAFFFALSVCATDWPQFLGPNRDGTISDETFVRAWLKNGIKEQWRIPIGAGYSGLAVQNNRIFTMERKDKDEWIVALQTSDGKRLWSVRTGSSPDDVYGGLGPRVTPSVDVARTSRLRRLYAGETPALQNGELVFTMSAQGDLLAFDSATGKQVWKRGLAAELGWRPPAEGTSCSPLIQEGRIYLIIGGSKGNAFAAFDRNTGKTLWTSQEDRTSYSSAVRWDFSGIKQVLFLSGSNLFSVNAETGKLFWKYPWPTYDWVNVATPIVIPPDRVFISAGYDQGAAMLRLKKKTDGMLEISEVWRNREMKNHFNNSVYHNSAIYGFDNAILKAIDAQSGKTLWREKRFGTGSIVRAGNYLIILSDSGELACAKADPEALNVEAKLPVLKGKCWTPVTLADGKIFLRNHNEIVCLTAI